LSSISGVIPTRKVLVKKIGDSPITNTKTLLMGISPPILLYTNLPEPSPEPPCHSDSAVNILKNTIYALDLPDLVSEDSAEDLPDLLS
jgi:hypothetical protein